MDMVLIAFVFANSKFREAFQSSIFQMSLNLSCSRYLLRFKLLISFVFQDIKSWDQIIILWIAIIPRNISVC